MKNFFYMAVIFVMAIPAATGGAAAENDGSISRSKLTTLGLGSLKVQSGDEVRGHCGHSLKRTKRGPTFTWLNRQLTRGIR